ncbi:hypothetical protein VV99796_03495 [Vibrio vulnificus]|uniref:hypothetical protein n=1 Tax=Vibrio vulnificus TaxID=672 RepID=UPI00092B2468|nr:hypothetical protein [Vibrio vulnificus]EHT4943698.1 hypothetical protein [Vibrio vulnificus]OJI21900.1 hypothetical protein VV99796_03495 [Vibrio vulnificus]OJI47721.1 hypothetical protein VVS316_02694 [Vibrio vulnificus]POB07132.1 hypothetical protein CRN33_10170 [Vibrio vulnificus]
MNKQSLYELYEKTYFHEMEVREKLVGRVQINFALIATGFAVLSYMVRMLDFEQNHPVIGIFILSVLASLVLVTFCIRHLVKAFWGNEYEGMPIANEIDKYRIELLEHAERIKTYNTQYPEEAQPEVDVEQEVSNFVYNKFRDCSSHNTKVNDVRSEHVHKSFGWLLYSSIPFLVASLLFVVGNLDVSSPRKETPIINTTLNQQLTAIAASLEQLNQSQGVIMSNKTPPPPPPPAQPPSRRVIQNDQPERKM